MSERAIGVVLSDVDGTQMIHGQRLPTPAVQAAAHGLRANGIPLLEVTGRSHALLRKLVVPLDLRDNLCTLDGGATVAHADSGEVVWSRWLSAERARAAVMGIGRFCTNIHFDMDSRSRDPQEVLQAVEENRVLADGAPSVFAIFGVEKGNQIIEALGQLPGIRHTPIMAYENSEELGCIQVVEADVDKHYGIVQMLRYAGLAGMRPLVIGDGRNDLPLFAAAGADGVKVAMDNANTPEELKDLADWVAPSVENDGFAVTMDRYELLVP